MIEYVNNLLGINNEISVPMIVSLVIFITAEMVRLVFNAIRNSSYRRSIRNSFRNIISEIIENSHKSSEYINNFSSQLVITNKNKILKHQIMPFLNTETFVDFGTVYNSFKKYFFFKRNKKEYYKKFYTIWENIETLRQLENEINDKLNGYQSNHNDFQKKLNVELDNLYKFKEDMFQKYKGKAVTSDDFDNTNEFNFFIEFANIDQEFKEIDITDRKNNLKIVYDSLIYPLKKLKKKYFDMPVPVELINIVDIAEYDYFQIVNNLKFYKEGFENLSKSYETASNDLKSALDKIS